MDEEILREHLRKVLNGHEAHVDWKAAIADLPVELRGSRPHGAPHSAWELLEHVRIAQWDILEFCRNPKHTSPEWPLGYWPQHPSPPNTLAWDKTVESFRNDMAEMEKLLGDPQLDLFASIPHGSGQTILREALLVADHNSYHLGQFVMLRRLLDSWAES